MAESNSRKWLWPVFLSLSSHHAPVWFRKLSPAVVAVSWSHSAQSLAWNTPVFEEKKCAALWKMWPQMPPHPFSKTDGMQGHGTAPFHKQSIQSRHCWQLSPFWLCCAIITVLHKRGNSFALNGYVFYNDWVLYQTEWCSKTVSYRMPKSLVLQRHY